MFNRMKSTPGILLVAILGLVLSGCSRSDVQPVSAAGRDAAAQPASQPKGFFSSWSNPAPVTVPAGTVIEVRLDQSVSSRSTPGSEFGATVAAPIVIDGKTIIPQGARARGHVVDARHAGRLSGVARVGLALESVDVNGKTYALETSSVNRRGRNHHKHNAIFIGGGTGLGALVGGLAGGGKGLLIGSLAGAGAGTAGAALTGKKNIVLPAETLLKFRLGEPISIPGKS